MLIYGMEAAYFLQSHATDIAQLNVSVSDPVNGYENLPVIALSG
jgi:hypothetical protein